MYSSIESAASALCQSSHSVICSTLGHYLFMLGQCQGRSLELWVRSKWNLRNEYTAINNSNLRNVNVSSTLLSYILPSPPLYLSFHGDKRNSICTMEIIEHTHFFLKKICYQNTHM
eukprot:TRINITY_DN8081_c0_g1_i1.p1 TRINITY_DN8081_c0_g1~~TRINITY_DN8081_c0_g1_i1.p1  ORF type:complete len:116 (+),score=0.96 TRINITY_DN8081_c0_g1_i1:144-491(+)